MPSYKAKAIILKSYKLGESDKIIKMYSQENGIISAVAKGARKVRSRFGGGLELFSLIDLEIAKGRNLDIITQIDILKSFKNISFDFYKYIFCELIGNIVLKTQPEGEASTPLFKLLYVCFSEIDSLDIEDIKSLKKIMCFFEAKFMKIIGYRPLLKNCCICNQGMNDLYSFHKKKISFSIKFGGILCSKCSDSIENRVVLSASNYRFLCDVFDLKLEDYRDLEVSSSDLKKIYRLVETYILFHTGQTIDSFKYLRKIGI